MNKWPHATPEALPVPKPLYPAGIDPVGVFTRSIQAKRRPTSGDTQKRFNAQSHRQNLATSSLPMNNRYQIAGAEGEFEPGSNEQVLRNFVGITSPDDMDELELRLLGELYDEVLLQNLQDRALTVADLKHWHHLWLGNVYPWAGLTRSVNLGKGGFQFAAARLLPGLLDEFERKFLRPWTPCGNLAPDEMVNAIAVTHVELIVIHPFREGNGRLSRLLADVMAVQAGHEPLDYSSWEQQKAAYIGAIHAGFSGDYGPMRQFVAEAMAAGDASLSGPA
ncbi:Fic family protein [Hydrogenophaga sp. IBVHS1]|uniref:Fic/DOC family protein n=1 Tax=unclassified Hydrogenophaga TaxID=2610897 RepID=UPI00211A0F0A|nr:Fic family protein [Hydrogenophaga sp. IBVHS1]